MKPYYEHAGITIYHCDCREVLPIIKSDVLITDPPYGVDFAGKSNKVNPERTGGYTTPDSTEIGPEVVRMALNQTVRGVVFSGTRIMFRYPEPADVGCVYCPAGSGMGRWGFTCFHPVLFYGTRPNRKGVYPNSIYSGETSERNGHPCPKPYGWMVWAIESASMTGETILDPFCGSGTTLEAAKNLGRKAIGIELEERYCEIAAQRLSQEVMDFSL